MPTDATCVETHGAGCLVCGAERADGMRLTFSPDPDGGVVAAWTPSARWESFAGCVHGGLLSTLLDEAMSHALMARGLNARTCELRVRLRRAVAPGMSVVVRGRLVAHHGRRLSAEATATVAGETYVQAWATFLRLPTPPSP